MSQFVTLHALLAGYSYDGFASVFSKVPNDMTYDTTLEHLFSYHLGRSQRQPFKHFDVN